MKTILITGAARGIGRDAAFALAKRGHTVIATVHSENQMSELKAESAKHNCSIDVRKLDIASEADVAKIDWSGIDVVVNNAAMNESGPMAEVPLDRVERLVETNIIGTLRVTQHAAKSMLLKKAGRIILVTSVAGRIILPYLGPYSMTKFALEGIGDALRMELAPHGIFVSMIEPGLIYTGFNERMAAQKYEWISESSAFASDIPAMQKHDERITESSYNSSSVVTAIIDAVESKYPKARYTRPRIYGRMLFVAKLIPTKILDRIMRKFAGL